MLMHILFSLRAQNQKMEFSMFPGKLLMTSLHCRRGGRDRDGIVTRRQRAFAHSGAAHRYFVKQAGKIKLLVCVCCLCYELAEVHHIIRASVPL